MQDVPNNSSPEMTEDIAMSATLSVRQAYLQAIAYISLENGNLLNPASGEYRCLEELSRRLQIPQYAFEDCLEVLAQLDAEEEGEFLEDLVSTLARSPLADEVESFYRVAADKGCNAAKFKCTLIDKQRAQIDKQNAKATRVGILLFCMPIWVIISFVINGFWNGIFYGALGCFIMCCFMDIENANVNKDEKSMIEMIQGGSLIIIVIGIIIKIIAWLFS